MMALGLILLVGGGVALKSRLLEEWYLWRSTSGNGNESRAAVQMLGRMKAVKGLLRVMRKAATQRPCVAFDGNFSVKLSTSGILAQRELLKIGTDALPELTHEMAHDTWGCSFFAAYLCERISTGRWILFRLEATDEARYVAAVLRERKEGGLQITAADARGCEDWSNHSE